MKTILTPEQKLAKKKRDNLLIIHNGIVSQFNFKQIKTWVDVYTKMGLPEPLAKQRAASHTDELTFQSLKAEFKRQSDELEHSLNGAISPTPSIQPSVEKEKSKADIVLDVLQEQKDTIPFRMVSRPEGSLDYNDCTVLALATCNNISYKSASDILSGVGREKGAGLRSDYLADYLLKNGFELVNDNVNISLSDAVEMAQKGKYIVRTNNHAFAIIDGVIYDFDKPQSNTRIQRIYKWKEEETFELTPDKTNEPTLDSKDNYGLEASPHEKAFLYWFQKKAAAELVSKVKSGKRGLLLLSGTGTGKTFIIGAVDRRLIDSNYHEDKTWSHIPRLYITKTTVVEQASRVFKNFFGIAPNVDTEIINIEQLRSKSGQLWVQKKLRVVNGQEEEYWLWKKNIHPCVVYFDESQGGKNRGSTQSQIIYAYNDIPENTCLISVSATPFTRVSEAQAFAVSTHRPLDHLGFPKGSILTNENWPEYARIIAAPAKPHEYNQSAIERLMEDLKEYIVRVRGVRPQFSAQNGVQIIPFESDKDRLYYDDAWKRFLREKAKIDAAKDAGDDTGTCQLVILLKFAMAAEYCHAGHFARRMYEAWKQRGKAPVAAVKFKQTLIQIVKILNEKYGINRDQISLIWGGGQTQQTDKQKAKEKVKLMKEKFEAMGIELEDMLLDMGLDEVEDRVMQDLPAHLHLGKQTLDDRQKEIDKFQSGKSDFALYTLKAGGVGLSLHHTDELTKFKCRRKESGYAVEEDIPKVPVRPRETFVVVTYNAIELVQGVGRVPRLTSLSPTIQNVYCFSGTVEVDMGRIYSQKLRCLSSVVKMHEDWQDVIFGGKNRQQKVEEALKKTEGVKEDESTLIDEGEEEEE